MLMRRALMAAVCSLGFAMPLVAQMTSGAIRGTVTDSIRSRPLAGVRVSLARLGAGADSALVATTDDEGHYRVDGLAPGKYALSFESALLDSLEFGGPTRMSTVLAGRTNDVDLAMPSGATLRKTACPGVVLDPGIGALLGLISDADSDGPLGGAQVVVAWSDVVADSTGKGSTVVERSAATTSDASGQYRLCGVATNQWLAVQVQRDARAGTVLRTAIADAVGVAVLNVSFSAKDSRTLAGSAAADSLASALVGSALLVGTIKGSSGQALTGVQVHVSNTTPSARTNERGEFTLSGLPAGTHELEVRQIGYAEVRRVVELRSGRTAREDIRLQRAVSLDSIRVVAQRQQYPIFESHRKENFYGTFLDAEQIKERHVVTPADLVVTIPRFGVGGGVGPHLIPFSRAATPVCKTLPLYKRKLNIVIDNAPYQGIYDVHLDEIGAMEFYPDPTTAPTQFEANCGLIIIWTKAMRKNSAAQSPE